MIDEEEEIVRRTRSKKQFLRVTFPGGKSICYKNITETMIDALIEIGSDKFGDIKLEVCHLPMLSKEIYKGYEKWMKPVCDGWYLNTQTVTVQKYRQLQIISEQFDLGLKVEMGDAEDFNPITKPDKVRKQRSDDKLLVKLPDGEFIANDSAMDTFIETIWQIGIDEVKRKGLVFGSNQLITFTKQSKYQVQVDTDRWLYVPNSTKDKVKALRVIAAMLHIKLEATII